MRLVVVGCGYVGLVAAAGFSNAGHNVVCVDSNPGRITPLRSGQVPIFEPGLGELIAKNIACERLQFSTDTRSAVAGAEVVCLAVNTPALEDGSADLNHVMRAAQDVLNGLTTPSVILVKSTVPVGTCDRIARLAAQQGRVRVSVVSNPEFLKEGDALNDFMKPARIILGVDDEPEVKAILERLYASFVRTNNRVLFMDRRSAELTKYAANAMLATRISFMNELSHLATATNADIEQVRLGVGADPRIGRKFLFAGAGFGGSCFPKDLRALLSTALEHDVRLRVVEAVEKANAIQKLHLAHLLRGHFGEQLHAMRVAIWGLSFKPRTDDVRESPAIDIIRVLNSWGVSICAYDPEAMDRAQDSLPDGIEYAQDMYEAARDADALVLVTEWSCFRQPDLQRLRETMRGGVLVDGRNVWNPVEVESRGFIYYGIGRPSRAQEHGVPEPRLVPSSDPTSEAPSASLVGVESFAIS